ncbi:MAG: hypothetical protein ACC700_17555 [Anaerolineales bacterium]
MRIDLSGPRLDKLRDTIRKHGLLPARWIAIPLLVFAFSTLLGACDLVRESSCPIDDRSFCEFVEEIEPLVEDLDSNAVLDRTALKCCKGDFAWPDEAGYDPQAECIRSGVFLGEGSCLTKEQFRRFLVRQAPLSVDYLVYTADVFSELRIDMAETAILVSTGDPEWFLVIFALEDSGEWRITAMLHIRRAALSRFPNGTFVSWPPDLEAPNPPLGPRGSVGRAVG